MADADPAFSSAAGLDPERAARALHARDPSAAMFGIELIAAGPTGAKVRMAVRDEMCNGFGILHGGVTFVLADSAMAFASNSENVAAVAASASIEWLAPVAAGEVLTAVAERRWTNSRTTVWDIGLSNTAGEPVALFRGTTKKVGPAIVDVEA